MTRSTRQIVVLILTICVLCASLEDEHGVEEPTLCEVCKILAVELKEKLQKTGKSKEVIEIGHGLDTKKKRVKYVVSELRMNEVLYEPHICEKILEYNVHKEKKGSLRFAKGRSQTMEALHGLVNKGVKVDLGMPKEMWDKTPAEITQMQRKCYNLVEKYELEIEDWYFNHQDQDFQEYFCKNMVLKDDSACLNEKQETTKAESSRVHSKKASSSLKGDRGDNDEL